MSVFEVKKCLYDNIEKSLTNDDFVIIDLSKGELTLNSIHLVSKEEMVQKEATDIAKYRKMIQLNRQDKKMILSLDIYNTNFDNNLWDILEKQDLKGKSLYDKNYKESTSFQTYNKVTPFLELADSRR